DALVSDQLGVALLEAGKNDEALAALETAVRLEARWLHLYHLARAQLAKERAADAAATARRALALGAEQAASPSALEKCHSQLGPALRRLGGTAEAAAELSRARGAEGSGAASDASGAAPEAGLASAASPMAEVPRAARAELDRRATESLARAYFNLGVLQ